MMPELCHAEEPEKMLFRMRRLHYTCEGREHSLKAVTQKYHF